MKTIYKIIFLSVSLLSCTNKKAEKKELSQIELQALREKNANFVIDGSKEKIILISVIKGMSVDSVHEILSDYYAFVQNEDKSKKFLEAIDFVSQKHHLKKEKVASIVFTFKYEMIEEEEMIEKLNQELMEEYQDYERE